MPELSAVSQPMFTWRVLRAAPDPQARRHPAPNDDESAPRRPPVDVVELTGGVHLQHHEADRSLTSAKVDAVRAKQHVLLAQSLHEQDASREQVGQVSRQRVAASRAVLERALSVDGKSQAALSIALIAVAHAERTLVVTSRTPQAPGASRTVVP